MIKIKIELEIETTKSFDSVVKGLTKGIYRGLDTEPNYIASPQNVKINSIEEIKVK